MNRRAMTEDYAAEINDLYWRNEGLLMMNTSAS